jgi:hypothetical protein
MHKKTTLIFLFLLILPQTIRPNPPSFRGVISVIRDMPPIEFGLAAGAITAITYIGGMVVLRLYRHLQKPHFKINKEGDLYEITIFYGGMTCSFRNNSGFENNYLNEWKFDFKPPSLLYVDDQLVCDLDTLTEFPAKIELP